MIKRMLLLALTPLLITSNTYAVVLADDNDVVSSSGGKFKDWSLSFFSIASVNNMKPFKKAPGDRAVESYDYFSANFKMDGVQRVSLRLPFYFNTAGYNDYGDKLTSNLELGDIHFVYSNYDLGYIGDVDLSGKVKVYLPTSRRTQNEKRIMQIRFEGYADYTISRMLSVAYIVKPDIYWQSQTASFDPTAPQFDDGMYKKDPRSTTQQFGLEHYLQFQLEINSMFSLATKTGFDEGWYYASAVENLDASHKTALRLGLDLWIRPARGLSFTLGMGNQTYLNSFQSQNVAIWQPSNTSYSLMTNWAMF